MHFRSRRLVCLSLMTANQTMTPLAELLWARGQVVALPVLEDDPTDRSMKFRTWTKDMALVPGRFDIPVPPPDQSSIIRPTCLVVSLTAFDSLGNRMGRGAGFFDRYLATANCQVIGVGFETQRMQQVPTKGHDVAMPVMATDLGVRYLMLKKQGVKPTQVRREPQRWVLVRVIVVGAGEVGTHVAPAAQS